MKSAEAIERCNHLEGIWKRLGRFSVMLCKNKDYAIVFDVDMAEPFFEGGSGAIQLFGSPPNPLKPVGDDEEAYQVNFLDNGFDPASLEASAPPAAERTALRGKIKEARARVLGIESETKRQRHVDELHQVYLLLSEALDEIDALTKSRATG